MVERLNYVPKELLRGLNLDADCRIRLRKRDLSGSAWGPGIIVHMSVRELLDIEHYLKKNFGAGVYLVHAADESGVCLVPEFLVHVEGPARKGVPIGPALLALLPGLQAVGGLAVSDSAFDSTVWAIPVVGDQLHLVLSGGELSLADVVDDVVCLRGTTTMDDLKRVRLILDAQQLRPYSSLSEDDEPAVTSELARTATLSALPIRPRQEALRRRRPPSDPRAHRGSCAEDARSAMTVKQPRQDSYGQADSSIAAAGPFRGKGSLENRPQQAAGRSALLPPRGGPAGCLPSNTPIALGSRLRQLRTEAGLSAAELGRRSGIHRPIVSRIESGRHMPTLDTACRYCRALGVPCYEVGLVLDELLGWTVVRPGESADVDD